MVRRYLSNRERILLHLFAYSGEFSYYNAPYAITQDGIGEGIGVGRNNVPRALKLLTKEGMIAAKKARVSGMKNRRKVYYLTPAGLSAAHAIIERLQSLKIRVLLAPGIEEEVLLGEVSKRYGIDFNSAALNMDKNRSLNVISLVKEDIEPVHYIEDSIAPSHFYGRASELEKLSSFFHGTKNVLLVHGLSGTGKTALLMKYVKYELRDKNVFFMSVSDSSTVLSLFYNLSKFLSIKGAPKLERFIKAHIADYFREKYVLDNMRMLLEESMSNAIYIFDNVENASLELKLFFRGIVEHIDSLSNAKLVFVGTNVDGLVPLCKMKHAEELHVGALDKKAALELLKQFGITGAEAQIIMEENNGNALLLTLAANQLELEGSTIEELFSTLSKEERRILEFLSVFRKPVSKTAIFLANMRHEALYSLITKNLVIESKSGAVRVIKLLRDAIYERLSEECKHKNNILAAEHMLNEGDYLSAAYHYAQAGKLLRAVYTLGENYSKCIWHKSKAIRALAEQFLERDKNTASSWVLHGIIGDSYELEGNLKLALEHYALAEQRSFGLNSRFNLGIRLKIARLNIAMGKEEEGAEILGNIVSEPIDSIRKNDLAMSYYLLGKVELSSGAYDVAESNFMHAKELAELIGNYRLLGQVYMGIGKIYSAQNDLKFAMETFEQALSYFELVDDKVAALAAMLELAHSLLRMGDRELAVKHYLRIKSHAEKIGDMYYLASSLYGLGTVHMFEGEHSTAKREFTAAHNLYSKLGIQKNAMLVNVAMGALYAISGDTENSESHYDMAIAKALEGGYDSIVYIAASSASALIRDNKAVRKYGAMLERINTTEAERQVAELAPMLTMHANIARK